MNYKRLSTADKFKAILKRIDDRNYFYTLLYKLCAIVTLRNFRLIIENPFSTEHFLHNNFLQEPTIIDKDRTRRGDFFKKPTGYWFFNCQPTHGFTIQQDKERKAMWKCKSASHAGLCSEERSMISPDYARNFICDFILGKTQNEIDPTLFDAI